MPAVAAQEGSRMATLVETVVSLENEANAIVAQAHAEAKELESSTAAELEAYRQKVAQATEQKVLAVQGEMEEKHKRAVEELERDLVLALDVMERIPGEKIERQIQRILTRFDEL
jgi:hypothetical protein